MASKLTLKKLLVSASAPSSPGRSPMASSPGVGTPLSWGGSSPRPLSLSGLTPTPAFLSKMNEKDLKTLQTLLCDFHPQPAPSPLQYDSPLLKTRAMALALLTKGLQQTEGSGQGSRKGSISSQGSSSTSQSQGSLLENDDSDVNCTLFQVEEWGSKRLIRVEVIEPVTITAKNFLHFSTSFTTYLIRIETNHYAFSLPVSEIRRRYSEFVWLRRKLCIHHPNKVVPPLPPKHFFSITNFNEDIINKRRHGLGKFLQRVFRSSVLLSDSALHLFLQTNLTTKEIDARVCEGGKGPGKIEPEGILLEPRSQKLIPPYMRSASLSSSSSGDDNDNDHDNHDDKHLFCNISTSSDESFLVDVEG